MKKLLYCPLRIVVFLFISLRPATAQNFIWANEMATGYNVANNAFIDGNGNSYVGGTFFDSIVFGITTIHSASQALFIAKYDPQGNFTQALQSTGTGDAQFVAMSKDGEGHIYVVGNFEGNVSVFGVPLTADTTVNSFFISKIDTNGTVYWVKTLNNPYFHSNIRISAITCDQDDSLYIYGYVDDTFNLDGIYLNYTNGTLYFAKLNPTTGTAVWARQIASAFSYDGLGPGKILTDKNHNVIVCGAFNTTSCIFNGTDTLQENGFGYSNPFIGKYDAHGNFLWAIKPDSVGYFADACIDSDANIYALGFGYYEGPYKGYYNKFNPNGVTVWQQPLDFRPTAVCTIRGANYVTASLITDSFNYMGYRFSAPVSSQLIFKTDTTTGALIWYTQPFATGGSTYALNAGNNGVVQYLGGTPSMAVVGPAIMLYQGGFIALLADTAFVPAANNKIKGNIFNDTNTNCLRNAEPELHGFGVIAEPGPYYGVSDSLGNYSINVDSGTYTVHQIPYAGHTYLDSVLCPSGVYTVSFTSVGQIDTGYNFPNKYSTCPLLDIISVNSEEFTTCDTSQLITLTICNYGHDTARNPVLTIHYPGYIVTPVFCSAGAYTYNTADSIMTLALGNIAPDSCLNISIRDTVVCSIPIYDYITLGYLPLNFHVTPNNTCYSTDSVFNYANSGTGFLIPEKTNTISAASVNIQIIPNPTAGNVTVTGLDRANLLEVTSMVGVREFIKEEQILPTETIDLKNLPPGIYLVSVRNNIGIITRKITKL